MKRTNARDDWISAARKALANAAIDDVKVDRLARRLKVSRSSFYYHFRNRRALLETLLDDWVALNRRELALLRSETEPDDMQDLFHIWLGADADFPAFDIAIRAWARKSRKIAKTVHTIDDAWMEALTARFERRGTPNEESIVRARISYSHKIGYHSLSINEPLSERARLAPHYYVALFAEPAPQGLETIALALNRPKPSDKRTRLRQRSQKRRAGTG